MTGRNLGSPARKSDALHAHLPPQGNSSVFCSKVGLAAELYNMNIIPQDTGINTMLVNDFKHMLPSYSLYSYYITVLKLMWLVDTNNTCIECTFNTWSLHSVETFVHKQIQYMNNCRSLVSSSIFMFFNC